MTEQQMDQRINHPVCEGKGWDNPKKKRKENTKVYGIWQKNTKRKVYRSEHVH